MNNLKKLSDLLSKRQQRNLAFLLVLLIFGMGLEIIGLGSLLPIITLILNPQELIQIPEVKQILDYFTITTTEDTITAALTVLVFVYLFKVCYLIGLSYVQNRFFSNFTKGISNKLFSGYLTQSYAFFLNRNTSEMIKNFQIEIHYFTIYLLAITSVITELGLSFAVVGTLIYIEPYGALGVIMFFMVLSFIFFQAIKKRIENWGKERMEYDKKIAKSVTEALLGIKEIKLLRRTHFFKDKLWKINQKRFNLYIKQTTLSQVPRNYLELITIFGLVGFIMVLLVQGKNTNELITTIGIFVAASFRMIPSINRVISSFQTIKFYSSSLTKIHDEFTNFKTEAEGNDQAPVSINKLVTLKNISFSYEGGEDKILNGFTMEIQKGTTSGIIGPSGCGKSTLIDIFVGLLTPCEGEILIDNQPLDRNNIAQWQKNIGYVSQQAYLLDDSILANIALGISNNEINLKQVEKVIEQAQLNEFINTLPEGIYTNVGERGVKLSGGQSQRISIARALYHNPEILVLDEATSALDNDTEAEVMKAINQLKGKKTILIIAHRTSTLKNCDKIYKL